MNPLKSIFQFIHWLFFLLPNYETPAAKDRLGYADEMKRDAERKEGSKLRGQTGRG